MIYDQVFLCRPFVFPPLAILSLSPPHTPKPTVLCAAEYNSKPPVSTSLIIFQPANSLDDYIRKIVSDKQGLLSICKLHSVTLMFRVSNNCAVLMAFLEL